jgi:hypothetical protein
MSLLLNSPRVATLSWGQTFLRDWLLLALYGSAGGAFELGLGLRHCGMPAAVTQFGVALASAIMPPTAQEPSDNLFISTACENGSIILCVSWSACVRVRGVWEERCIQNKVPLQASPACALPLQDCATPC